MRTAIADTACITEGGGKAKLLVFRTSASAPMKSGRQKNEKKGVPKWKSKSTEKSGIKSEFLMPKKLTFRSTNTYYELFKPSIEAKAKEAMKSND